MKAAPDFNVRDKVKAAFEVWLAQTGDGLLMALHARLGGITPIETLREMFEGIFGYGYLNGSADSSDYFQECTPYLSAEIAAAVRKIIEEQVAKETDQQDQPPV